MYLPMYIYACYVMGCIILLIELVYTVIKLLKLYLVGTNYRISIKTGN